MKRRNLIALTIALFVAAAGLWSLLRGQRVVVTPSDQAIQDNSSPEAGPNRHVSPSAKPPPTNLGEARGPGQAVVASPVKDAGTVPTNRVLQQPPTGAPNIAGAPGFAPWQAPQGGNADVEREVNKIKLMLRDYRTLMGENPVGTNAEIMKAINGANPKGAKLGPPEGMSLNGSGELLDTWGTAYFFHQLSGTEMEIRSAGQDRKMWTGDDITLK